jgi:hypothetical protein
MLSMIQRACLSLTARLPPQTGQDYARDRPPEIGAAEHQRRRQARDVEEVVAAGKRAGRDAAATAKDVAALAALLPGGLNLFKMRAADWLAVSSDVNAAAARLITLKTLYPSADVFKLVSARPRVLLYSEAELRADAAEVHALLAKCASVCAVVEAVPELSDAGALRRALATLRTSYPGQARRMPLAAAIPAAPPHSPSPPPSPRALTLSLASTPVAAAAKTGPGGVAGRQPPDSAEPRGERRREPRGVRRDTGGARLSGGGAEGRRSKE